MFHPHTKAELFLEYSVDLIEWHRTFAIPGAETTQKYVRTVFLNDGKRWMPGFAGSCVIGMANGPREEDVVLWPHRSVVLDTAPLV